MGPWDRARLRLVPALLVLLAALTLAYCWRNSPAILRWLSTNKDAVEAFGSLVSAAAIVAAAVLGYYRFFKGRTFSSRADVKISVDVLPTSTAALLHAVVVSVTNVGTVTVWDPRPQVELRERRPDGGIRTTTIENWYEILPSDGRRVGQFSAVDSGETVDFHFEVVLPPDTWAVTYSVLVSSAAGECWAKLRTVANAPTGTGSQA